MRNALRKRNGILEIRKNLDLNGVYILKMEAGIWREIPIKIRERIVPRANLEDAKSLHLHVGRCSCRLSLARSEASASNKSEMIEHIRQLIVYAFQTPKRTSLQSSLRFRRN